MLARAGRDALQAGRWGARRHLQAAVDWPGPPRRRACFRPEPGADRQRRPTAQPAVNSCSPAATSDDMPWPSSPSRPGPGSSRADRRRRGRGAGGAAAGRTRRLTAAGAMVDYAVQTTLTRGWKQAAPSPSGPRAGRRGQRPGARRGRRGLGGGTYFLETLPGRRPRPPPARRHRAVVAAAGTPGLIRSSLRHRGHLRRALQRRATAAGDLLATRTALNYGRGPQLDHPGQAPVSGRPARRGAGPVRPAARGRGSGAPVHSRWG